MASKNKKEVAKSPDNGFKPKDYVTPNLKEEEVVKIKEIFDIFDYDKSGNISPEELKTAITALGMEQEAQKIMDLVNDLDTDKNAEIDFGEFL
jgi:centrin-1